VDVTTIDDKAVIFAPATGMGRAAVSIVRVSGAGTRGVLETLCGRVPQPRRASLMTLRDPANGDDLDQALILWFPGPASFTGEDMAELQCHGGRSVLSAVLRALGALPQCRPAEAGEFTRRALLNGRMTLDQVEGLADLIDAETEAQRRQALRSLEGETGQAVGRWREDVVSVMALMEAAIDFSDESDVSETVIADGLKVAQSIRDQIESELRKPERPERLRDGYRIVLAGPPNAGKSTLLNALARRDAAIVSPFAGTTRDVIEVHLDLGGYPVLLVDTAGLRESEDVVEREGIRRTQDRIADADLVLWLQAPGGEPCPLGGSNVLVVGTKADLGGAEVALAVSATTGTGIDALLAFLQERAERVFTSGEGVLITRERHRTALQEALLCLDRALAGDAEGATELVAEDLRLAARALGRITGEVDIEEILDRLFSGFCIGK
jgi:tRNA modification GTPase